MKVPWMVALALLLVPTLAVAIDDGPRLQAMRRVLGDRMTQFNTNELDCQLGMGHSWGTEPKGEIVTFYYALGTRDGFDVAQMNSLEDKLFQDTMQSGMTWCTREMDEEEALQQNAEGEGRRRFLRWQVSNHRELNVILVNSGPTDEMTDLQCPPDYDDLMEFTGATRCDVLMGSFYMLVHEADDASYLEASLLDHVQDIIDGDMAHFMDPTIPDLAFLKYLGDTKQDAIDTIGVPLVPDGGDGDRGIGGEGEGEGDSDAVEGDGSTLGSTEDDDGSLGVVLGVTIPLAVALLAVALLYQRKRNTMTESEFHEMMDSNFVLAGMADPPGSFHEGLYHYLRDGTRYLSTRCEHCLETRKNSFYTDHDLGTIHEDEEFEDVMVGLAAKSPTVDVHRCSSSTCDRCNSPRSRSDISFITAPTSNTSSPLSPTADIRNLFSDEIDDASNTSPTSSEIFMEV